MQLLLTLAAVVTVMGALSWGFNFVSLWFSARAVGDVVLACARTPFARHAPRPLVLRSVRLRPHRQPGDLRHAGFCHRVTLTIDLLSQIVLVLVIGLVLLTKTAAGAHHLHRGAHCGDDCPGLSAAGAAGDAAGAARPGHGQRHHPGDDQRHCRGQEFPPGSGHLRGFSGRE